MILNHLIGIYTHPKEEWQSIDTRHETSMYALTHIAIIALIPSIVAYYSSAHTGWSIGAGDLIKLDQQSALMMAIGTTCMRSSCRTATNWTCAQKKLWTRYNYMHIKLPRANSNSLVLTIT